MAPAEIRRRVGEVAAASGIDQLVSRTTDELSGGESQQLAIAGALMLRPRVLSSTSRSPISIRPRRIGSLRWCAALRTRAPRS